jgi:hypothetical protein
MLHHNKIAAEWEKVKEVDSLFGHYGSQAEYQRWRQRFLRAGYISKSARRYTKKRTNPKEYRREYARVYARKWRESNPAKAKAITYEHWKRKLLKDFSAVRLNPV